MDLPRIIRCRPIPRNKQKRCGLWLAARKVGKEILCPIAKQRCERCVYHVDLVGEDSEDAVLSAEAKEKLKKKRQMLAYQRAYYAKRRTGNPIGRPKREWPKPSDQKMYMRLYMRLYMLIYRHCRAQLQTMAGKPKLGDAVVALVLGRAKLLPEVVKFEDTGGNLWEFNTKTHSLVSPTRQAKVIKKIKGSVQ